MNRHYLLTSLNEDMAAIGMAPARRRTEAAGGMPPAPRRPAPAAPKAPPVPAAPPPEDDSLDLGDEGMDQGIEDEGAEQPLDPAVDQTMGQGGDLPYPGEEDEDAMLPPVAAAGACTCPQHGAQPAPVAPAPMEARRGAPAPAPAVRRESILSPRVTALVESARRKLSRISGSDVSEARRGFRLLANSAHYVGRGLARANKVHRDARIGESAQAMVALKNRCIQYDSALKEGKITVSEAAPRHAKLFESLKVAARVYDALIEDDEPAGGKTDEKGKDSDHEMSAFNDRELPDGEDNGLAVESEDDFGDDEDEEDDEEMIGESEDDEDDEDHEEPDGDEPFPGAAAPFGKEESAGRRGTFRRGRGRGR